MPSEPALKDDPNIKKLTEYCESAKHNNQQLKKLKENPVQVLQTLGIPVEDEFKEAVTTQFQELANIIELQKGIKEAPALESVEPEDLIAEDTVAGSPTGFRIAESKQKPKNAAPTAPTGLRVVSGEEPTTVPPEVINALEFQVKPWGLVLVVREPAIKYVKGGGTITTIVLAALAPIPIAGAILAFFAFFLGINIGIIEMMDQGKGVNITLTWAHILLCGVGLLVPAITPIK